MATWTWYVARCYEFAELNILARLLKSCFHDHAVLKSASRQVTACWRLKFLPASAKILFSGRLPAAKICPAAYGREVENLNVGELVPWYSFDPPLRSQELGEESDFLAVGPRKLCFFTLFQAGNGLKPLVGVFS